MSRLPNAQLIVDLFHVVQLANKMIGDVRRRVTFERYGRRGRATDLEYAIKNLLLRGAEKLSQRARGKLLCALSDLGDAGRQLSAAWRAKELLRHLVKLSPNRTGVAPARAQVAAALEALFVFCGTVGASVPEVVIFAETVSAWRAEICRGALTGYSNAAAEGVNRLVKLVYRSGFGFTNVINQQRRSRYVASRSTRPVWLASGRPSKAGRPDQPAAMATRAPVPADGSRSHHLNLLGEDEDRQLHAVSNEWMQSVAA
jgi:transposase